MGPEGQSPEPGRNGSRRLLPESLLGLASLVFFMGIAAAFTGAVLYAYYDARLERAERRIEDFVATFGDDVEGARTVIQSEADAARQQLDETLSDLAQFAAGGETIDRIRQAVDPSVFFVETADETGAPSVGSAFVAFSDGDRSFLLTSFTTVRAATAEPAPGIVVRRAGQEFGATLASVDPGRDLALLTLDVGDLPALSFIDDPASVSAGERIFAVSGLGAQGATLSQGVITDVAGNAIQHDAGIGAAYQGGPIVDASGRVLAVASRTYAPSGFDPLAMFYAPPIRLACEVVISCPG